MKKYLSMNTMYLTNNGLKYIYDIDKKDQLIYRDIVGNLVLTDSYKIDIKDINEIYDNFDSKYSRLVSNESKCPMSVVNINKHSCEDRISKFYIKSHDKDEIWYNTINYDKVLCISLIISNFFIKDNEGFLVRDNSITNKYTYDIFKKINDFYGIYFPYSKSLKSFNFKTNLYLEYDRIEEHLIENIIYSKQITETLLDFGFFRGYDYKSALITRYSLACILQIYFNLNGYDTKVEKENNLFRLTIIKSCNTTYAHRDKSYKMRNSLMGSIQLTQDDGYLIVSQQNDGITNVSFIDNESI